MLSTASHVDDVPFHLYNEGYASTATVSNHTSPLAGEPGFDAAAVIVPLNVRHAVVPLLSYVSNISTVVLRLSYHNVPFTAVPVGVTVFGS